MRYVVGFLFNEVRDNVLLIRKNKPAWQAGLLNGIGGKIEEGETPELAMIREFLEETGERFSAWRKFAIMFGSEWECHCFCGFNSDSHWNARTMESEIVIRIPVDKLNTAKCVSNLPWLISLALDLNHGNKLPFVEVSYQ